MNTKPPLFLMRHGTTQAPQGYCIGQWDVPLSVAGAAGIEAICKDWQYPVPGHIVCSDLNRARQTAEIVAAALDCSLSVDRRLREISFGSWEGRSWDDIYRQDRATMQRWGEDWLSTAPPQGESTHQLAQRVSDWHSLLQSASGAPLLIIAHAGSLQSLLCLLDQVPLESMFDFRIAHGEVISRI
jgi:alpha-ribazole phosphatase